MTTTQQDTLADLTRPIIGIENRTADEVFSIMVGRIRLAALSAPTPESPMRELQRLGQEADAGEEVARLRAALGPLLKRYVDLANSGDAGFWDPELEPEVIAARAVLEPQAGGD